MAKYLLLFMTLFSCTTLNAQLWEQVGGEENGSFGMLYGDTITNTLYSKALIFPDNDTIWAIVKFDSTNWSVFTEFESFGGGGAMTRYNGNLVFGSGFKLPGGDEQTNIARYNGTEWEKMGSKGGCFYPGPVHDLLLHNGDLYASGRLNFVDSVEARVVAKWDGEQWTGLRPERFNYIDIRGIAMAYYKDEIYAGGHFGLKEHSGVWNLARWDGDDWHPVGGGTGLTAFACGWAVNDMAVYKDELYIGGCFPVQPMLVGKHIMKWDGNQLKSIGAEEPSEVDKMVVFNGELYVAGRFQASSEIGETDLAKWDGEQWCSLGSVFNGTINDMEVFNGELYVSGNFNGINGEPLYRGCVKWIGGDYVVGCGTPVGAEAEIGNDIGFRSKFNPVSERMVFDLPELPKERFLRIFDLTGTIIYEQPIVQNGTLEVNASSWSPGLYLAILEAAGQVWTEKVVVQR